jgi:hypothetical protein
MSINVFWEICALGSANLGTLIWTLASLKSIVTNNSFRLNSLEPDVEDLRERVSKLETINECKYDVLGKFYQRQKVTKESR